MQHLEERYLQRRKELCSQRSNFLRPFIQQLTEDNKLPEPNILTRAPLAALANAIATITGFPSLVQNSSVTSQQNLRALHLTAAGIYDTFRRQLDIPAGDANWITNSYLARKSKPATFGAFFDMDQVESLAKIYASQVKDLDSALGPLRKKISQLEVQRVESRRKKWRN